MKQLLTIVLSLLTTFAHAGALFGPKLTPPPAPVVSNALPAMPEYARLDATVRLTYATGLVAPFLGSTAWGEFTIGQSGQNVAGRLAGAADASGNPFGAGNLSFDSFRLYPSGPYLTGRTERSWGWADVRATRTDGSNIILQAWGETKAKAGTFIVVGAGVLIPEAAPVVTNEPPVVNPNTPQPATWERKTVHGYSKDYKIKTLHAVKRGFIVTTYNKDSRHDSFVDEYVDLKKTMIYKGSEETLGAVVEEAAVLGDLLYLQAEVGKNVLIYNQSSGKVAKGIPLASHQKFNVENTPHAGTVVFGASGQDGDRTAIYDAVNGRKLWDSPLRGLISGLSSDGPTLWWVVAGEGIANSAGQSWKAKAASVAVWKGVPHYGSQVDGAVYALKGGEWVKVLDADASKVNWMVEDERDGALLISAANPDTFLRVLPGYKIEQLARFTDQPKKVSEEQFDTKVVPGPGKTILGSRAKAEGAEVYLWSPKGTTPTPDPVTPPATPPATMPSDLPAAGQSGFLWKPDAEGGGGGLVVLFNSKLIQFVKSATINGKDSRQQVPPYEDGRGAIRWSGKTFPGAVTLVFNLTDGRKLNYAIPNGLARTEKVKPAVSQ